MKSALAGAAAALLFLSVTTAAQEDARDDRLAVLLRTGQYAAASQLIDELLKSGKREDLANVRALFGNAPDMRVKNSPAGFACDVTDTGVVLPVTVNGTGVDWLADTGANFSVISDAEAKRLGMEIRESTGRASDLAGGSTSARTAVARRIVIGGTQIENALFLVTPVDVMPWRELPAGKQGILGLPLIIALDALRWTRTGMCHTGSAQTAVSRVDPNLRLDRLQPIVNVGYAGKTLEFVLDTGNQAGTQLWERFGKDFQALVKEHGRKSSVRVTQMGGSNEVVVVILPEMRLTVGNKEMLLKEGKLFAQPVGNDRFYGLLGFDVLRQADEVTLDFRAMTVTLK